MNTEIVTPQQARQIARRLFLKLYPDQEDWFDLAWGCYARLGVQTESGVKLANLPGLGAVAGTDPLTENTINYFVSFANAFLIEHPIALGRLLERYSKESKSLPTPISDPDISDVATRVLREGPQSPSVPLALGSKDERQARQTSQNKESTEKRADDLRGLRTNANIVWVGMLTDLIGHEELVGLDGYRFFLPKTFLRCFQVAAFEECNEGELYCYVGPNHELAIVPGHIGTFYDAVCEQYQQRLLKGFQRRWHKLSWDMERGRINITEKRAVRAGLQAGSKCCFVFSCIKPFGKHEMEKIGWIGILGKEEFLKAESEGKI